MRVTARTPLHPTEVLERVVEAATRFFPDATVEQEPGTPGFVVATSSDLRALRKRVWELRIIDTFRGKFLHGAAADGRSVTFRLSKQAALAGKVSFPPSTHILGDLEVHVELEEGDPWPDAEALGMWLCPETKDGEIVGPIVP